MKHTKLTSRLQVLISIATLFLLAGFQLVFTPLAHATAPTVDYSMTGSCAGQPCGESIDAEINPSNNYAYQAWVGCTPRGFLTGGWKFGTEQFSNTGSCASFGSGNHVGTAGFIYTSDFVHMTSVQCWSTGHPLRGRC